ncbi:MAG: DUF3336 domain-containing protein [Candidatus Pelagadaptatus aseana]|uniref:patatin-like phospholipase family protein n=1 Tax=Candidatus Pelagadaptatus aseana TaxID=3120508 RepID=UPI0039B1E63D
MIRPNLRKLRSIQKGLNNAQSFREWQEIAQEYDRSLGLDEWREKDRSGYYPYELLKEQIKAMRHYRKTQQFNLFIPYLKECLHRTLGELTDPHLYNVALTGTKHLITEYLEEVETSIKAISDAKLPGVSEQEKLAMLQQAETIFGRTALMLSGGGLFGVYHLGVIKVLLEHDLVPNIISGSSMGAFINGVLGTQTNEELLANINRPEEYYVEAFAWLKPAEMLKRKALFDPMQLLKCMTANFSDLTFKEAFDRTGRIINITISPTRAGQKPRILNYKTAPDALISYAALASCAVPFAFPSTQLMERTASGEVRPYMDSELWADGAVNGDIPTGRMSRLHNANHFIVSQTNPHVLPFVLTRESEGVIPFALDFATSSLKAQLHQTITVTKKRIQNRTLRFWMDRADAVLGQDYMGDINIYPELSLKRYRKILTNPNHMDMVNYIEMGERATWPKLAMIENETRISRVLQECCKKLEQKIETEAKAS